MIQIRKANIDDAGFILDTLSEVNETGDKILPSIDYFLICESSGEKCGFGCARVLEKQGYINWLTVKEEYRRQKLGSAIMKALLNVVDLKGVKEAYAVSSCDDFLSSLKFSRTEEKLPEEYEAFFGPPAGGNLFKVSLEGYFGTCSQK